MRCADANAVRRYLAGELDPGDAISLELHAAGCAACGAQLLAAVIPGVTGLPREIAPPRGLRDATLAAMQRAHPRRRRWIVPVALAAAAAVVLMVIQPAPKKAATRLNPTAAVAARRAQPELAALDRAEQELVDALAASPDDPELHAYLTTVQARRAAIARLVREAAL
ncbi:MAG: zf-HC2 domain-containing protein [Gemmatimonadales bacterium]